MTTPTQTRLQELIAEARAKLAAKETAALPVAPPFVKLPDTASAGEWTWNKEQQQGIDLAMNGKSFCLIGAAGTGKTSTLKEVINRLVAGNKVQPIDLSTKYLERGRPGIVLTSFTRRAVRNIKKVVSTELKPHCITIHKLLEFEPQFYEVYDEEEGKNRITMRFEPARNRGRKLPGTLTVIVIDEASMPSVQLFKQILDALVSNGANVMFIFVGDLHQLPPVYGQAILGFKLLELPTVELTHIYRQAALSPIIDLAHKVKNGEKIPVTQKIVMETTQGKVTIHPWKKPLSDFDGTHAASAFLRDLVTKGDYDEEEDIILCPQEKTANLAFGTNEFNRVIAQALGDKRKAVVVEVIAGFQSHYYAVGDRVLVGREDAIITRIERNARYYGKKRARPPSEHLDRWGSYKQKPTAESDPADDFDTDAFLDSFVLKGDEAEEDRKQEASHIITVKLLDSEAVESVGSAGDINAMQFAYALTVHKAQGSEWKRVFFLTHQSHVTMWSRELLYTAITRAREELYMIVEPDRNGKDGTLTKAARSPRIKGDTLAEKAEWFKGKKDEFDKLMAKGNDLPEGKPVESRYKGAEDDTRLPALPVQETPPPPLVKLHELVPDTFKHQVEDALEKIWNRAKIIWGDKIGVIPTISYKLQKSRIVGQAVFDEQLIKLNALWSILASRNEDVREQMLGDTLVHECCHLIAASYSKDRAHGTAWNMAMQLMGAKPNVFVADGELPSWAHGFKDVMQLLKEEFSTVADTSEEC